MFTTADFIKVIRDRLLFANTSAANFPRTATKPFDATARPALRLLATPPCSCCHRQAIVSFRRDLNTWVRSRWRPCREPWRVRCNGDLVPPRPVATASTASSGEAESEGSWLGKDDSSGVSSSGFGSCHSRVAALSDGRNSALRRRLQPRPSCPGQGFTKNTLLIIARQVDES